MCAASRHHPLRGEDEFAFLENDRRLEMILPCIAAAGARWFEVTLGSSGVPPAFTVPLSVVLAVSMWCVIAPVPARAAAVSRWATAAAAVFLSFSAVAGHALSSSGSFSSPYIPVAVDRLGDLAHGGLAIACAAGALFWVLGTVVGAVALRRSRPAGSLILVAATVVAPLPLPYLAVVAVVALLCAALLGARARRLWGSAGMGAAFATINVGNGFIRRLLRPQYLWVAYPGTERDKRLYFPECVERLVRPLYSTGLMRFGRYWGLMVAGKATAESLDDSPERLRQLLDDARGAYPGVQVIALAGRLPSLAVKAGIPLETPFTPGDKGTLCTMVMTAREQASLLSKAPGETVIAVVGGAGFVGRRLVEELRREFRRVVCLDPRFTERRGTANVLYTAEPEDIASAEAVLVLTSRGDQAESVIPCLTPGTVVADDTHPEIPSSVRRGMESAGALVFKATMGDSRFRIMPRVPFFRSDDIPGCVLEALVVLEYGREVLVSQAAFNDAASALGFGARLAPHISSV